MYSVIEVPNRPWFDNIREAKQGEGSGKAERRRGRGEQRQVHTCDFVPDDTAVIVHADAPGAFTTEPHAEQCKPERDAQLNIKSEILREPEQQHARQRADFDPAPALATVLRYLDQAVIGLRR